VLRLGLALEVRICLLLWVKSCILLGKLKLLILMGSDIVELESYFEFLAPDDIRIKGTRIGIETVLDDYLNGASPEEIAARYSDLTLKQMYATIIYYLHHQEQIDAYLEAWRRHGEEAWSEQQKNPPPVVKRLQALKRARLKKMEVTGP